MRRWIGLVTIGVVLAAGGVAWWLWTPMEEKPSSPGTPHRIVVLERKTLSTTVTETGILEPMRTIDIKSPFSGEVRRLLVSEGDDVAEGQSLAVIRQEPAQARQAAQLRAQLEQERLNVEQARRNLVRQESLYRKGFASRLDWENAEQEAERAMVRRELAERELLLALGGSQELFRRYVSQEGSATPLETFEVISPSSGTVIQLKVQAGEMITSGTATVGGGTVLMQLADLTTMVAKAKINEVNIARVRIGQPVTVTLDALPGAEFQGTVKTIAPQGEKEDSIVTYEVIIHIENTDLRLRPMMTANVDILTDELENVLVVPLEALQAEAGQDFVLVEENGREVKKPVKIAFRTASEAVVTQGLKEGDRVILPDYAPPVEHP